MRFRAIAVAALFVLIPAGASPAEPLPARFVLEDLTWFRDTWAAKKRSFSPEARGKLQAFLDGQIVRARPMERWELALVFSEAAALSENNHTQTGFFGVDGLFHTLPISFWLFPDGAYVIRAHPDFRRLLGARILRIGGVAVPEAAERVAKYIAGTAQHRKYVAPSFLARLEVLQAAGLASADGVEVELELASGVHVSERLPAAPTADPMSASEPANVILAPGKASNPWPQVLDGLSPIPLHARPPDEFTSERLDDGRVLYVRSTSLSPYEGEIAVQTKAYDIIDDVVKSGKIPGDVIVDLRYNGGGNFFNILAFSVELPKLVGPEGRVYVLTGRATNSAAIVFTALLKANAAGRMTQVGEEVSDDLRFWSEGGRLTAPASKLMIRYTDGYHDWASGCTDLARCYWPVVFHGVAVGSLHPDIPVEMSFADYRAGRDPLLDAALSDVRRRRSSPSR